MTKLVSKLPTRSYVKSVGNAIKEAKLKGVASRLFGDYLAVAVLDVKRGIEKFSEEELPNIWRSATERLSKVKKNPRDVLLPLIDNNFAVANVAPTLAPFSIFPLEPSLRFALMTGEVLVVSRMNISGLGRWLVKRGWIVEIPDPSTQLLEDNDFPFVGAIKVWNEDGIGSQLSLEILMAAAMEFRMRESIESEMNALVDAKKSGRLTPGSLYQVAHPNYGNCAWD